MAKDVGCRKGNKKNDRRVLHLGGVVVSRGYINNGKYKVEKSLKRRERPAL